MKIKLNDTTINVSLSGDITKENIQEFINSYKSTLKKIKTSRYSLVIEPKQFDTDEEQYIKKVFKMFLKGGFKSIYLVDAFGLTNELKLSKLEKNFFLSKVKIISSINDLENI